jgi:response regulator RpfG family c-di-GMP phosphodiesterase
MLLPTKPKLIAIDRDDAALREICTVLRGMIDVLPLKDPQRALATVKHDVSVVAVIVDQDACPEHGVTLLRQVRQVNDKIRRVLLAAPGDLCNLIEGLHSEDIERVVYKPIDRRELLASVVSVIPTPQLQKRSA